jgi:protease-4
MLQTMTGIYTLFLARVAEGRGTTPDKIAPFAEGRLFSGTQAKEHGLVDELGGLHEAIAKARSLAGLPADAAVGVVSGRASFLDVLDGAGGEDDADSARAPVGPIGAAAPFVATPANALDRFAPDLAPYVTSLAPLTEGERALVAIPYAVILR